MVGDLIRKRRSTVLFSDKEVSQELLHELFQAAKWAPSSLNIQPWRFIYARKGDEFFEALLNCLKPTNQVWASRAPILMATITQTISDYKNRPNIYAWHDTGMAYATLAMQATDLGLSLHPMGGFERDLAAITMEIKEPYEVVLMSALGYKSSARDFDQELLDREAKPRSRKPLEEFVFHGKFANTRY